MKTALPIFFSSIILIIYVVVLSLMNENTTKNIMEDISITLPVVFFLIFFLFINRNIFHLKANLSIKESFNYDLLVINYSYILAALIEALFEYNNSDAKAWWGIALVLNTIIGLIFSLYFSLLALMIGKHKKYTYFFSFILLITFSFQHFYSAYIYIPQIGNLSVFWVLFLFLFLFHFIYVVAFSLFFKLK